MGVATRVAIVPGIGTDSVVERRFALVRKTGGARVVFGLVKSFHDVVDVESAKAHRFIVVLPQPTVVLHAPVVGVTTA